MKFPILYAPFTAVQAAFNSSHGHSIRKIVFQFQFNESGPNNEPTLVGFAAKQNGYDPNPDIVLTKTSSYPDDPLNNPLNLGSLEFTRPMYENLTNPLTYLVFSAIQANGAPNSVTYKLTWSDTVPLVDSIKTFALDELNPSPPKQPY